MEEDRRAVKGARHGARQGTLTKHLAGKVGAPPAFTCENVLHLVIQFIAVNDQVSTH